MNTRDLRPVAVVEPEDPRFVDPRDKKTYVAVRFTFPYAGVDRPVVMGIMVDAAKRNLIDRLCRAINDGAAVEGARVATDINGNTYVAFNSKVMGKYLNADLTRLGY